MPVGQGASTWIHGPENKTWLAWNLDILESWMLYGVRVHTLVVSLKASLQLETDPRDLSDCADAYYTTTSTTL